MKIQEHEIKIRDLIDGYVDNQEEGVIGFHRKLNIRPAYQRELVYNEDQQRDVMRSVRNDFPLNVMYFMVNEDGTYELLDGQQRTLSICRYCDNQYSLNFDGVPKQFHNLTYEEKEQILNYGIKVYFCTGTVAERKRWFEIINFKGESLTRQELLNAFYCGPWVTDAKRYFSKNGCVAYLMGNDYLQGKSAIRQEIFETVLKWIADKEGIDYEEYMAIHQHDETAEPLWEYFVAVIEWVQEVFGCPENYRSDMKKVDWGYLYNKYHNNTYDPQQIEEEVSRLMSDYEVTKRPGIYKYIFDRNEKHLNLRTFDERTKKTVYERQKGVCPLCGNKFKYNEMHGDHIKPWSKGGTTVIENCQMLCTDCNIKKSNF